MFQQKVSDAFWNLIFTFVEDLYNKVMGLIQSFILLPTDMNAYFSVDSYLGYVKIMAGSLLLVAVAFQAIKMLSGNILPTEHRSIGRLAGQTVVSAILIFVLPVILVNVLIPLNNYTMGLIVSIGVSFDNQVLYTSLGMAGGAVALGGVMIVMILILVIAFIILSISAGIRYFELIITYILSPLVAVSAINKYEAISIWAREAVAIVFTQSIHVLCLQLMMSVIMNMSGLMMIFTAIGALVVLMKGPKMIRQFLYTSGAGSAVVNAAGAGTRMAAMKIMFKSMK